LNSWFEPNGQLVVEIFFVDINTTDYKVKLRY